MIVTGIKPGFLSFSCSWLVGGFFCFLHNAKNRDLHYVAFSYYKCENEQLIYETKL